MQAKLRKGDAVVAEVTIPDNPNHDDGRLTVNQGEIAIGEYTLILEDGTERQAQITRITRAHDPAEKSNEVIASYTNAGPN